MPVREHLLWERRAEGVTHYMMQISGELCNVSELLIPIAVGVREGWLRCRRIDLQMTCIEPASWNQWGFFNRQKLIKNSWMG